MLHYRTIVLLVVSGVGTVPVDEEPVELVAGGRGVEQDAEESAVDTEPLAAAQSETSFAEHTSRLAQGDACRMAPETRGLLLRRMNSCLGYFEEHLVALIDEEFGRSGLESG